MHKIRETLVEAQERNAVRRRLDAMVSRESSVPAKGLGE
jgi:hypothetical protein